MIIGIGSTIPEITNLPGQRDEGVSLTISYPSSAFCDTASDPSPTVSGNVGAGTFSSTTGLVFVNNSTGVVDISNTVTGTYTITYTDTNSAVATTPLEVVLSDNATFSYSASSFPQDGSNPTPTTVLAGGTFTSGSGLVFVDTTTGEINLSASTIGSYTITYNTSSVGNLCPSTFTQPIAIASAVSQIDNVYSMEFNGADENINVGNVLSLQGASVFTISSWIKLDSTGANRIFGSWIASTTKRIIGFAVHSNNTLVLQISNNGSSFQQKFSTSTIPLDTWKHVAVTFSSGAISFYIDGVKETPSASTITQLYNSSSDYFIGALQPVPSSTYMNGLIDEVGIFNTALTEAEVQSIYNATAVVGGVNKTADLSQLTTPPVKWYRMGD